MAKILVAYYSFEGNTKQIAEHLAKHLGADLQEIKPVKELKSKGFSKYLWGGSQVVMGKSPELLPIDKNFDDYDLVLVGTPIWAATYAPPIKTLLEGDYIKNKKVGYFYCHEGGAGKAEEKAKQTIEKNNTFVGAKGFVKLKDNFDSLKDDASLWADSLK